MTEPPDRFASLDAVSGVRAAFLTRVPGVDVTAERDTALARLKPEHDARIVELGFSPPVLAEQVHGSIVAAVEALPSSPIAGADGLVTATRGLTLGIYVADCAAVYLVDPHRRAIALVHSGRKGTELNIVGGAVKILSDHFNIDPSDLIVVVAPCIRSPHYEVDFAATIRAQARDAGVCKIHDAGICTASHPDRYYSYRREQGRTGRMLALLMLEPLAVGA